MNAMLVRLCVVTITLAYATLPAPAQSKFAPIPRGPVPEIPCYCRTAERQFEMGETTCLRIGGRAELARCEMILNNPSWTLLNRPCNPELTQ
jgi:hypothetical protein